MASLREIREDQLLTREELAHASGLSVMTLARLETGINKPRFRTIRALAKALKVQAKSIEFPGSK